MKRTRWIGLCALLAACVVGGAWAARSRLLPWAARWLDVSESPRKSDYVLALGGEPALRPFVALTLLQAGFAQQILVSQVLTLPGGLYPPDHELSARAYRAAGVPPEKLIPLGRDNQATYDEACALAAFLETRPDVRVLVVTSTFHTRRARWIFRQALGARADALCWVAAPEELYQAGNWWRTREGLIFVPSENLRFFYYLWRYSAALRWTSIAAALLITTVAIWITRRRGSMPIARQTR